MTKKSFALEVAAPSPNTDRLAPWVEPYSTEDVVISATFWATFQGLSAILHVVVVVGSLIATLLPIPFLAATCSTVRPLPKPPEPVEIALVKAPEPPPPPPPPVEEPKPAHDDAAASLHRAHMEEGAMLAMLVASDDNVVDLAGVLKSSGCARDAECKKNERCVDGACAPKPKSKHPKPKHDEQELAMIGLISGSGDLNNALGGIEGGAVLGSLKGDSIGDAFGTGGLGLRGSGVSDGGGGLRMGGGGTALGLGSIGTIGHGSGSGVGTGGLGRPVKLVLGGVSDALRARLERRLKACHVDAPVRGTVTKNGVVTSEPKNACVESMLRRASDDIAADEPYEATPAPR